MASNNKADKALIEAVEGRGFVSTFTKGGITSKLSYIIIGLENVVCGQVVKGLLFFLLEVAYFVFMATTGIGLLKGLKTLGTHTQEMVFNEQLGIFETVPGDNSMLILLSGVIAIVITVAFIAVWLFSISSGEHARAQKAAGRHVRNFIEDVKSLGNDNIQYSFLAIPVVGLTVFTVMPLLYMILMAFTNYDSEHQPPGNLFHWVGLANFKTLLASSDRLAATFWPVLGWTAIWGVCATFTCYFGGMILAIVINSKGINGKKFWRTLFVITYAIPAFISLRFVATMLGERGIFNILIQSWGWTDKAMPFLTNATWARVTVIIVNFWIGVPVTMLMVSGILMNIPAELYESAKIDGATPFVQFWKITFPYMWFVTTPYLISNLIGNFNNFNAIYFLTGGAPNSLDYFKGAGKTDLLVTWLYKLTKDSNDYNLAATIGILIFVISATFTLITFSQSGAVKNEEGFQ